MKGGSLQELDSGGGSSGLERRQRLWQWAAVGAAVPLGQGTGHGGAKSLS